MKNKICLVVPYFGKFNNYFQLFLNSCERNEEIHWLFFTDDRRRFDYPKNVKVVYCSFEEIKKVFQSKFTFKISLERPYKLCDYKCSYGYVFCEYLREYDFWGHCDVDLIFGKITDFITDSLLEQFDKIGIMGHFTIFRNTDEINTLFMNEIDGSKRYQEVFMSPKSHIFDEGFDQSINTIFELQGKKMDYSEYEANLYTKTSNFRLTELDLDTKKYLVEGKKTAFFVWDQGRLIRYYCEKEKLVKKSYMYIHLQCRKMKVAVGNDIQRYKIIPNAFELVTLQNITYENFDCEKIKNFNLHYFKLRTRNLWNKIKMRFENG